MIINITILTIFFLKKIFYVINFFFIIKPLMLGIIIQLDISTRLIPHVTTIICHHMKKVLLKNKRTRKKNTKIWGTTPKPIC